MTIYIIRHTSVDVAGNICYGQTDVPLKKSFSDEAEKVKNNLEKLSKPDAVFSSPLNRCVRLAHFCNFEDAVLDDRLKELNFGDWEMCNWNDLNMEVWENDWISNPPPNGESLHDMFGRVSDFFNQLKEKNNNVVFIFAHAGVINCAKVYFGQETLETSFDHPEPYGSIVAFELSSNA